MEVKMSDEQKEHEQDQEQEEEEQVQEEDPEENRVQRRLVARHRVNYCEHMYNDTQNPLYVWKAIREAGLDCSEYPNWIKKYLCHAAEGIINISEPDKDAPKLIKKALDLPSARAFDEFHHSWQKDDLYDRVMQERRKRKHGEKESIFEDVAEEFYVSEDTAKKWFNKIKSYRDSLLAED
jgi:hypothetical protein